MPHSFMLLLKSGMWFNFWKVFGLYGLISTGNKFNPDFPVSGPIKLTEVNPLPSPQLEPSVFHQQNLRQARQHRLDMGVRVVLRMVKLG
jgi:hypothetical protein